MLDLETLMTPVHYEQRAFDVERERAEATRLLKAREANSIALGEHFLRAKDRLSKPEYGAYLTSLGLHALTAEGFIRQARAARGEAPVKYPKRKAAFTKDDLKDLLAALKAGEVDAVIAALEEVV